MEHGTGDLAAPAQSDRAAQLGRDRRGDFVGATIKTVGNRCEQGSAFMRCHRGPGRERAARGADGIVDITPVA
jgi:hypothetical protein